MHVRMALSVPTLLLIQLSLYEKTHTGTRVCVCLRSVGLKSPKYQAFEQRSYINDVVKFCEKRGNESLIKKLDQSCILCSYKPIHKKIQKMWTC